MAVWTWAFGDVGGASEGCFLRVGPSAPDADTGRKFRRQKQVPGSGVGALRAFLLSGPWSPFVRQGAARSDPGAPRKVAFLS